jgi:hypothetical protein
MDRTSAHADPEQLESKAEEAHYVWQYFTVTNYTVAKKGRSKNACCMSYDALVVEDCQSRCTYLCASCDEPK